MTTASDQKDAQLHITTAIAGFDVKVQNAQDSAARLVTIGGTVAGLNIDVESSDAADSYTVGGSFSGVDAHYTSAKVTTVSTSAQDDGADFNTSDLLAGEKATAFVASMNGITVKHISIAGVKTNKISTTRGNVKYTASKAAGSDAKLEAKVAFKF